MLILALIKTFELIQFAKPTGNLKKKCVIYDGLKILSHCTFGYEDREEIVLLTFACNRVLDYLSLSVLPSSSVLDTVIQLFYPFLKFPWLQHS